MSEYTNFVKIGACTAVLQMIEDNYINKDFTLRNPVKAIKDITYDVTCKRRLRLDNGREYSPIEIQREYCELAQKYIEQYPVSDELRSAVEGYLAAAGSAGGTPKALVAPHAGYVYSGQIAADAFRQAADHPYDTVVVLGTNHTTPGLNAVSIYDGDGYRTPLGTAAIDRDLVSPGHVHPDLGEHRLRVR